VPFLAAFAGVRIDAASNIDSEPIRTVLNVFFFKRTSYRFLFFGACGKKSTVLPKGAHRGNGESARIARFRQHLCA
ncbi:MAG: hypothetical protein EB112_05185, partial [Actinobacteria bacterium]|nr:hypothetical protein [Actinomycetota bacterium]NDG10069.1 hypothetical protein [Actinomycetota bacterium]